MTVIGQSSRWKIDGEDGEEGDQSVVSGGERGELFQTCPGSPFCRVACRVE